MVLAEDLFVPVNIIFQPVCEWTFMVGIPFQAFFINHNLPSHAAGRRAFVCQALKLLIIIRNSISHLLTPYNSVFNTCNTLSASAGSTYLLIAFTSSLASATA